MSPAVAKVFWLIVNPANILTGLLVLGVLLLFTRWRRTGRGLLLLNVALREWLSLAHYYFAGRTDRFLPKP